MKLIDNPRFTEWIEMIISSYGFRTAVDFLMAAGWNAADALKKVQEVQDTLNAGGRASSGSLGADREVAE